MNHNFKNMKDEIRFLLRELSKLSVSDPSLKIKNDDELNMDNNVFNNNGDIEIILRKQNG